MSRNENRLGLPDNPTQNETPAATTAAVGIGAPGPSTSAPVFNWSVPTEFVELPSRGIFYQNGHPLHNQTTVEIRYMTAKEEDILTSRSLLREGIALDRMLQNILVDKTISIDSLLVGDKNAMLVAARRTGYGADYDTNVTCPSCGTTSEHSFDISEPPCGDFLEEARDLGVAVTEDGTVQIQLPMSKVEVTCRFMTSADEAKLTKELERKAKRKMSSGVTTDSFRAYIISVNGDSNPFTIESFIQAMPARDARHLRTVYSSIVPNIDLRQDYDCPSCGYEVEMEVPLGVDFFWPK
jgi:rubredoxin